MSGTSSTDRIELGSPPERLRSLLLKAMRSAEYQAHPSGKALALVVGTGQRDLRAEWYRNFSVVWELIEASESFVRERIEGYDTSPHRETFQQLRAIIGELQLETQWQAYVPRLEPLVTMALPFVIHSALAGIPAPSVARADVEAIRVWLAGGILWYAPSLGRQHPTVLHPALTVPPSPLWP